LRLKRCAVKTPLAKAMSAARNRADLRAGVTTQCSLNGAKPRYASIPISPALNNKVFDRRMLASGSSIEFCERMAPCSRRQRCVVSVVVVCALFCRIWWSSPKY
jgi:hypothetical protein